MRTYCYQIVNISYRLCSRYVRSPDEIHIPNVSLSHAQEPHRLRRRVGCQCNISGGRVVAAASAAVVNHAHQTGVSCTSWRWRLERAHPPHNTANTSYARMFRTRAIEKPNSTIPKYNRRVLQIFLCTQRSASASNSSVVVAAVISTSWWRISPSLSCSLAMLVCWCWLCSILNATVRTFLWECPMGRTYMCLDCGLRRNDVMFLKGELRERIELIDSNELLYFKINIIAKSAKCWTINGNLESGSDGRHEFEIVILQLRKLCIRFPLCNCKRYFTRC